ncbi:MAG: VOC family protein [Planctomycetes bacterium]|nr:VOC family protein [Planctomycetota bacterium]
MPAKLFRVIVPVSDVDRAADFYVRVLGIPGVRVSNGRHYFDCGGTILACFDPKADGDSFEARPLPDHLYFSVENLEHTYDACKKAGAKLAAGEVHGSSAGSIAVRPWGERSFYAKDPFDNPICFVDSRTLFTGARPATPGATD